MSINQGNLGAPGSIAPPAAHRVPPTLNTITIAFHQATERLYTAIAVCCESLSFLEGAIPAIRRQTGVQHPTKEMIRVACCEKLADLLMENIKINDLRTTQVEKVSDWRVALGHAFEVEQDGFHTDLTGINCTFSTARTHIDAVSIERLIDIMSEEFSLDGTFNGIGGDVIAGLTVRVDITLKCLWFIATIVIRDLGKHLKMVGNRYQSDAGISAFHRHGDLLIRLDTFLPQSIRRANNYTV